VKTIDGMARNLARPTSRRSSLFTIGGSGLAAIASLSADAAGKKKRKKDKKKDDKKCKRQVDQCNGYFVPLCEVEGAPEECTESIAECCASLGNCQAEEFIDCLMTLMRPPEPEDAIR
jgi:hypothetical protein